MPKKVPTEVRPEPCLFKCAWMEVNLLSLLMVGCVLSRYLRFVVEILIILYGMFCTLRCSVLCDVLYSAMKTGYEKRHSYVYKYVGTGVGYRDVFGKKFVNTLLSLKKHVCRSFRRPP